MIVEVDLYSGRPNPRFALEPAAAYELARRIEALAPAGGDARPRDGLGYRGLRMRTGPDDGATTTEIVVSGGLVTVRTPDGPPRRLEDHGRELERWLLDEGAGKLDPAALATARQDLTR
ncbi:hypothetical protein AB0C76_33775 [Kitasatospora sp. NPDC048722]|uniref:hypothetical protein n=1 Tax=Kitasatospora sp. NPDC048722 TaxID=3155639 RepID=UPI0033F3203E